MAGTTDHSSAGQTGPVARRPAAGRRQPAVGSGREPVSIEVGGAQPAEELSAMLISLDSFIPPDITPREIQTQAAYRLLVTSGFSGADAAGLISFVVGLPQGNSRWSLSQVNRLLFLRNLYVNTHWGRDERRPT